MRINLPNAITVARLVLAGIFLVLLGSYHRGTPSENWKLEAAFWIFIVAAVSDILDGYLARKQNQVTSFGRILDPFVDKILVCGGFLLLLGDNFSDPAGKEITGLSAWMVVVIIARELMVTGLRGVIEARGRPFGANYWGKIKMVTQSITIPLIIKCVDPWRDITWVVHWRNFMIWTSLIVTVLSAVAYLAGIRSALKEQPRD